MTRVTIAELFVLTWVVLFLATEVTSNSHHRRPSSNPSRSRQSGVRYEYFDDYLISIAVPDGKSSSPSTSLVVATPVDDKATDDEDLTNGSGDDGGEGDDGVDILGYFRDVPREHWSCCMLGKLAGDKGFHCHTRFYSARLQTRNVNRAHLERHLFVGQNSRPRMAQLITRTFQRCVVRHATEFHKCCYAATEEKRERQIWSEYRKTHDDTASQEQQSTLP